MTEVTKYLPAHNRARNSRVRIVLAIPSQCRQLLRQILHKKLGSKMLSKVAEDLPLVPDSSKSPESMAIEHDVPGLGNQPFRFLDLPKELRLMVYDLLVVVGKVFYSPDWYELAEHKRFRHWTQYTIPSLEVFYVCKQIKEEAEDVYLSKNLFVLPYTFKKTPPISMWCRNHSFRPVFSNTGLESLRNLSIAFCNRASAPLIMTASDWVSDDVENESTYDEMTPADRQEHAHRRAKEFLRSHWNKNVGALKKIQATLDTLEIDLNNAFCPWGCCRDFEDIDFGFLCRLKPNTIRLLGLRAGEEEKLLTQMRTNTQDESGEDSFLGNNCRVICNPEDDPWEKFRESEKTSEGRKKKGCNW